MAKRYVPPGARHKETASANTKSATEDSQRTLDDIVQDVGGDVFVVNLRSKNKYSKYSMSIIFYFTL